MGLMLLVCNVTTVTIADYSMYFLTDYLVAT
jgi:hypothetical protein